MFDAFQQHLHALKAAQPGQRFQAYYEQRHDAGRAGWHRALMLGAAGLVVIVGLILMPAPGPGMPVVAFGAMMMAGESQIIARWLDRTELALRRLWTRLRS